jgi:glutaredoxin-like protein
MASLLDQSVMDQVQEIFSDLKEPVQLLFFGRGNDCEYCEDTRHLVEEVADLSDKIHLNIYDLDEDHEIASQYKVDKAPGMVIAGRDGDQILDYGIRFAGIPSGHEFSSLIHDLILVSGRDSGLNQRTRDHLNNLDKPLFMQVFVTPT